MHTCCAHVWVLSGAMSKHVQGACSAGQPAGELHCTVCNRALSQQLFHPSIHSLRAFQSADQMRCSRHCKAALRPALSRDCLYQPPFAVLMRQSTCRGPAAWNNQRKSFTHEDVGIPLCADTGPFLLQGRRQQHRSQSQSCLRTEASHQVPYALQCGYMTPMGLSPLAEVDA